jgi:3-hydroxybutyrate dehydrogenase
MTAMLPCDISQGPIAGMAHLSAKGTKMQLDGKVAIVTGAASGIGREIARQMAAAGASIAIADLDERGAIDAAAAIATAHGGQAIGIAMDVTDEAAVDRATEEIASRLGGIDILVANAGIQVVSPLHEFAYADWKRVTAIHLDGAFLTARAALRHMYRQGRGGSIIFMGSVHSKPLS